MHCMEREREREVIRKIEEERDLLMEENEEKGPLN